MIKQHARLGIISFLLAVSCSAQVNDPTKPDEEDPYIATGASGGTPQSTDESVAFKAFYPDSSERSLMEEYFLEMFIYKGGMNGQERSTPLRRWIASPRFVWDDSVSAAERLILEPSLREAVATLTGGVIDSTFLNEVAPTDNQLVVLVAVEDDLRALGRTTTIVSDSQAIVGGTIEFNRQLLGSLEYTVRAVVWHEVGHLLSDTLHSGMLANLMSYNFGQVNVAQSYELEAFRLLYQLEPGMTWADLKEAETISFREEDVAPRLVSIDLGTTIRRGTTMALQGARMHYRWGCNQFEFTFPEVTLNGQPVDVVRYTVTPAIAESPGTCTLLSIRIPADAESGRIVLRAFEMESNPLEVTVSP